MRKKKCHSPIFDLKRVYYIPCNSNKNLRLNQHGGKKGSVFSDPLVNLKAFFFIIQTIFYLNSFKFVESNLSEIFKINETKLLR